jgi:hypothetical protein
MGVKHRIPHDLDHALARRVTRRALETYRDQFPEYKPQGQWLDEDHARLSISPPGGTLIGDVVVTDDAVELELEVPFLFRPFRKQAIKVIEDEVQEWIARAKAGELDDDASA